MKTMNLLDILNRNADPKPWAEGERVPWDDPDFSRRVLHEHLSQDNDAASRPAVKIKEHVDWIHQELLKGRAGSILDLGCGPGLYTARLAKLGHTCLGIDFAPAAIEYAKEHAPANCRYMLEDIRSANFGKGFDLVFQIFGAFNLMQRKDAGLVLEKALQALKPGGLLLLEASNLDAVDQIGNQPAMWYSAENGIFSGKPHICLMESFWNDEQKAATERFYILDTGSNEVTHYSATTQGYEDEEIAEMLEKAGFEQVEILPSMTGREDDLDGFDFLVITAKRPG